jgi:hypothetical protein
LPTAAERDKAFIAGHRQWPQDGWFAYAAGYSEAEQGHWQAAIDALTQARRAVPSLADPTALDEARLRRYLNPQASQPIEELARVSNTLHVQLVLEAGRAPDADQVPTEYAELARGNLPAAQRAAAGDAGRADRLLWLLAASDGAPAAWAEQALARTTAKGLDSSTAFAAAGLALRHGRDPAPFLAQAGLPERAEVQTLQRFVQLLRERGTPAEADRLLQQMPLFVRAQACSLGVIALGAKAPRAWREMASRMLFAAERPYFAG